MSYDPAGHGAQVRFLRVYMTGERAFWQMTVDLLHSDETMQERIRHKEGRGVLRRILALDKKRIIVDRR